MPKLQARRYTNAKGEKELAYSLNIPKEVVEALEWNKSDSINIEIDSEKKVALLKKGY